MKKFFTLFAALMMVFSMNAATKTIYCKMAQSWWKSDGAAVGAYYWGTGTAPSWPGVRMTPVAGETDLWSIDIDTDKFQNIIFTRVNGSGAVSDWGAKTADLTIPTDANLPYQGAMDVMGFDDIDLSVFENTKHIHLSSLFMQTALLRDIDKVLAKAAANGVTVSLDTQWDPVEKWEMDWKKVLPYVTVFLPNEKELMALTGTKDVEEAIAAVLPYIGNAMVVKMGSKGSLLVKKDGSRNFMASFLNKDVVDAIGAGDSFNSGFISAFVAGHPLEDCQRNGNLTGAVNTTAAGGTGAFTSREAVAKVAEERFNVTLL